MPDSLYIQDVYPWLQDVARLDIAESGICFFSNLGLCDEGIKPVFPAQNGIRFTYSLLPEGRFLNAFDRSYLESIEYAALLFFLEVGCVNDSREEKIAFFAVDLDCDRSTRAAEAYGVHRLIAKIANCDSVVMFRAGESVAVSFQSGFSSGHRIVSSDWIDPHSKDCEKIEKMHIANCSLEGPRGLMESMADAMASAHFSEPLLSVRERCRLLRDSMGGSFDADYRYLTLSELVAAAEKSFDDYLRFLGDDCLLIKGELFSEGEIDEEEELAWLLEDFDDEIGDSDEKVASSEDTEDEIEHFAESSFDIDLIPREAFDDPIALLKLMDGSCAAFPDTTSDLDDSKRRPPCVGDRIFHREQGDGVVVSVVGEKFSVEFSTSRRWLVYPASFEQGRISYIM